MNRTTEMVIRTAVLAIALVNQVLSALGRSPLNIEGSTIELLVSTGATVAAAAWAWWKNNSVTKKARQADKYLDAIKTAGGNADV